MLNKLKVERGIERIELKQLKQESSHGVMCVSPRVKMERAIGESSGTYKIERKGRRRHLLRYFGVEGGGGGGGEGAMNAVGSM